MGYTPLFDSIIRGTLCAKWPDIGLWPVLLSMTDWRGEIDATHQYIATVTGLPLEQVTACIDRFCAPDPSSRSQEAGGARLELIDKARTWGWRVVNIQKYRDKASGMAQVVDGRNAEKVRRYKERHRGTPRDTAGHHETPPDTHSYSNTDKDSDSDKNKKQSKRALRASRVPADFVPDLALARKTLPGVDAEREAQKFRDWEFKTPRSDWDAAWRTWVQRCSEKGEYARLPVNGEKPLSERYPGYKF